MRLLEAWLLLLPCAGFINGAYILGTNKKFAGVAGSGLTECYDGTGTAITIGTLSAKTTAKLGLTWEDGASPEQATYNNTVGQANTGALDADGYDGSSNIGIGCYGALGIAVFNGTIRDVYFYSTALTQAQMESETTL